MKIRDALRLLREDGSVLKNQEGSHRQFVHPVKAGKVTIAGHLSDELDPKAHESMETQNAIVTPNYFRTMQIPILRVVHRSRRRARHQSGWPE
jgi:predicted RNA binding protein YcfA (HicA-like mRNA interferase family)